MPALNNALVTFTRKVTTGTAPPPLAGVPVFIRQVSGRSRATDSALHWTWEVCWDSNLTYQDGTPVRERDEIAFDALGPNRKAALKKPRPSYGSVPLLCAEFVEVE